MADHWTLDLGDGERNCNTTFRIAYSIQKRDRYLAAIQEWADAMADMNPDTMSTERCHANGATPSTTRHRQGGAP